MTVMLHATYKDILFSMPEIIYIIFKIEGTSNVNVAQEMLLCKYAKDYSKNNILWRYCNFFSRKNEVKSKRKRAKFA